MEELAPQAVQIGVAVRLFSRRQRMQVHFETRDGKEEVRSSGRPSVVCSDHDRLRSFFFKTLAVDPLILSFLK